MTPKNGIENRVRIRGKKVTFKQYLELGLKRGVWRESPEEDFARDALGDKTLRDYQEGEWENLETHIRLKRGCDEAVEAAKKLFQKWRAAS